MMNYKRRISAAMSVFALFLSLVIPITNQAFVESSPPRQKLSHRSNETVNRSNLVDRSEVINSVDKSETVSNKRTIVTWRGGQSDHRWSNSANWVGGHVPGASESSRSASTDSPVSGKVSLMRRVCTIDPTSRSSRHPPESPCR